MITIITGTYASGKTAILREKLLLELATRLECYYLNFNLDFNYFHTLDTEESLETIPDRFQKFVPRLIRIKSKADHEDLLNYFREIYGYCKDHETKEAPLILLPEPPAFFLDEAYTLFDNRNHQNKIQRSLLYFITYLSMRGVTFYLATPDLDLLDKRLLHNMNNRIDTEVLYKGQEYQDIKIKITETRIEKLYNTGGFNKIAGMIN